MRLEFVMWLIKKAMWECMICGEIRKYHVLFHVMSFQLLKEKAKNGSQLDNLLPYTQIEVFLFLFRLLFTSFYWLA